jgi:di/tricarboxylate transporter
MPKFRFTIASLLVLVLFVAVGFAALREASDLWDSGLFTLTLGVLLISTLLATHRADYFIFPRSYSVVIAPCAFHTD